MTTASKTETLNVYQRLNAARSAFHATKLKKTGKNTFAGYSYFELGDFLIPALQIFAEHGLCAVISFSSERAFMEIRNIDDPSEMIEITSPMGSAALKGCHEVQNIGAVETYQRRYLWTAALEIVEHDAIDATTGRDAGGQSNDAQSAAPAPEKPKPWREESKLYSTPTALHKGLTQLERELMGCGDSEMVYGLCSTEEWREFARVAEKHAPHYLRGGDPAPPEFEGLLNIAERMVREFDGATATNMAALART